MPSHHPAKAALYEVIAQVAQATANPHRLELLDLLVQAPRSVEQLAELSALSIANTSQHLQRLKRAGLVSSERRGASIWYRIAAPAVARLWIELRSVAEQQLAEMDRALDAYRTQRHAFTQISTDALMERIEARDVILLDVRPQARRPQLVAGGQDGAVDVHRGQRRGHHVRLRGVPRPRPVRSGLGLLREQRAGVAVPQQPLGHREAVALRRSRLPAPARPIRQS